MRNKMYQRPYIQIRGFSDESGGKFWLETSYVEGREKPVIARMECDTLKDLHLRIKRCIAYAKRHTYDYDVNFIIF